MINKFRNQVNDMLVERFKEWSVLVSAASFEMHQKLRCLEQTEGWINEICSKAKIETENVNGSI